MARRVGGDDCNRAFAVAAVKGLCEVGLLGLGRDAGRRAAALDVDQHERKLGDHRQAECLALEREARTGGRRDGEVAGIGGADGGADARDLVLSLQRLDTKVLVDGKFLEDGRSRGDRVGTAELCGARPRSDDYRRRHQGARRALLP